MGHKELAIEAGKSVPPVAVSSMMKIFGIPLPDIVVVLTFIWLLMQMGGFVYDRFIRNGQKNRRRA